MSQTESRGQGQGQTGRLRFENLLAVSDPFQLSPSSHLLPRSQPQPSVLRVVPWGAPADCALYAPARLPGPRPKPLPVLSLPESLGSQYVFRGVTCGFVCACKLVGI